MLNRSSFSLLNQTFTTADRLGATVPKPIRAEYDRLCVVAGNTHALDVAHDLSGAVVAALADGRDPGSDPEVQRQVTLQAVAHSRAGLDAAVAARAQSFIAEHADALLASFRQPFDQAAGVITAHVGQGQPQPWGPAQVAVQTITAIQQAWRLLGGTAPQMAVDPRYWSLTIAAIPPAAFIDDNVASPGARALTAWTAAAAGYPLSLATPATLADRIAGIRAELEERQRQHAEASAAAIRRQYGTGQPIAVA